MDSDIKPNPLALIADDDLGIRKLTISVLQALTIDFIECDNGESALKILRSGKVDIAVLDVCMPRLSGLELCATIKTDEALKLIPTLILTANDKLSDKVEALELGADDYLTKPFQPIELRARVSSLLRLRDLLLELDKKNRELSELHKRLIEQERQVVATQLAGTAAHQLNQPLAALLLNTYLLESLDPTDPRFKKSLEGVKGEVKRLSTIIEKLRNVDGNTLERYHHSSILEIKKT
jgi:DNA-binding response OmpR family regulator